MSTSTDNGKQRFYFRGCFYRNEVDYLSAVIKFNNSPITKESFNEIMQNLNDDLFLNLEIREKKIKNYMLKEICEILLTTFCNEINDFHRRKCALEEKKKDEK